LIFLLSPQYSVLITHHFFYLIGNYVIHWAAGGENAMNEPKKNRPESRTGQVPRLDLSSFPVEPPQPAKSPETSDPGSSTGIIKIVGEGEDRAKHKDDSASSGQVDAGQPGR
jgi:hypothetical protein